MQNYVDIHFLDARQYQKFKPNHPSCLFLSIPFIQLAVEKITVDKQNGNVAVFYQNKEMQTLYNPFKVVYVNDTIDFIQFKATDSLWSRNFKRAIASAFQLKNLKNGAFVEEEVKKINDSFKTKLHFF